MLFLYSEIPCTIKINMNNLFLKGFKAYFPLGIIKVFKFLSQTPETLIISFSQAESYSENHANMFRLCRDPREVVVSELKAFETSLLCPICCLLPGTLSPS